MKKLFTILFAFSILSSIAQDPWQEQTGDMPPARAFHTMVEINDTVYVFGGESNVSGEEGIVSRNILADLINDLWGYNSGNHRWSRKNTIKHPTAREYHAAAAIENQMYVFGGLTSEGVTTDIWVYDPAHNKWMENENTSTQNPKVNMRATTGDNKIWITGGYDVILNKVSAETWSYDPSSNNWEQAADCPEPRLGHVTFFNKGKLFIFGGKNGDNILNNMWVLDIEKNGWTQITPNGTPPDKLKFATFGDNGKVLWMAGGTKKLNGIDVESNATWEYDIANNKWTKKSDGPTFSYGAGVILPDINRSNSYVTLIYGGKTDNKFIDQTWIYSSADDYEDNDNDGYTTKDDCDDDNSEVNPGATEIPYDGIDNDCDSLTLDDDLDQDGYNLADDCDDNNSEVNPSATEIPYDGIDNDCDSLTLDDDLDQDGYNLSEDCDDNNSNIYPGAEEIPNNGIDEDCDGEDLITSVFEVNDIDINVFPNPASKIIFIRMSKKINYMASLYNTAGEKLICEKNLDKINTINLKDGLYILEIKNYRNEIISIMKILVQKNE